MFGLAMRAGTLIVGGAIIFGFFHALLSILLPIPDLPEWVDTFFTYVVGIGLLCLAVGFVLFPFEKDFQ